MIHFGDHKSQWNKTNYINEKWVLSGHSNHNDEDDDEIE